MAKGFSIKDFLEEEEKPFSVDEFLGEEETEAFSTEEFLGPDEITPTPTTEALGVTGPTLFMPRVVPGSPIAIPPPITPQKALGLPVPGPSFEDTEAMAAEGREKIADFISPQREEILKEAGRTGEIPKLKIAGRALAETAVEMIPMTPTDVALFGAIGIGSSGLEFAAKALASRSPLVSTAGRVLKTPLSQLGKRGQAIKRFGLGREPGLGITQPGIPKPPVRPRPLLEPEAPGVVPPKGPIVKPGVEQKRFGPIIKPGEEHLAPITSKNVLGPIDKTKPLEAQLADVIKLDKPKANATEPIIATEGPTVLGEAPVNDVTGSVWQRELIDRFTPLKGIPKKGISPQFEQAGGGYSKSYVAARLLKGKIRGKSELLLDEVNRIVEPLRSHKERLWLNEIYTMRNFRDLDMIGRTTSNVTVRDANMKLGALERQLGKERFARISKVADDLADIQNNKGLEILVEGKVISPKTAAELRSRFPNYLRSEIMDENLSPLYPELIASSGEQMGRINRGFLKTKLGTTKMINNDVLDVIRRSLISKMATAEKQQAVNTIAREFGVKIGRRFPGGPRENKVAAGFAIKGQPTTRSTIDQKQIIEAFDSKKIPAGWVRSSMQTSDGRIVAVRKEVDDLMKGLNVEESDMITRMMSHYNNFFRLGATTYRLPFVIANLARDTQALFFNKRVLPGQKSTVVAGLEGGMSAIKAGFGVKDKTFKEFLDSGAAFGGIVTAIPKSIKLPFRLRPLGEQARDVIKGTIGLPFEEIGRLAQISENTSRLAEFLRVKRTPLPDELKALQARDITIDFEKMGNAMKVFNRWIPFLNAQVQGELNTGRAIQAQPLISMGRIGYQMVVPAVSFYSWNRSFKNDEKIDPFIKDNYFYVNSGIEIDREGKKVPVLFIARKGEAAKWFTRPLEMFMEWSENDPQFRIHMKEYSAKNLGSAMLSRVIPPALSAAAEQWSNWDLFRRRPVVPQRLQDVEPGSQFTTFTSNTARLLGEATGLSPVRMESLARSLFPASPQIFEGADVALRSLDINPTIPRKDPGALRRAEAFVPIARAPSGFFGVEKEEAIEFLDEEKVKARTPRFLFEEAFKQFIDDPNTENRQRMVNLGKDVSGPDKKRIMMKIRKRQIIEGFSPREQAIRRLPRRLQQQFRGRLRERGL